MRERINIFLNLLLYSQKNGEITFYVDCQQYVYLIYVKLCYSVRELQENLFYMYIRVFFIRVRTP